MPILGSTGADPHEAEVAILKCFETLAQCRGVGILRAVFRSEVYLRTGTDSPVCSTGGIRTIDFLLSQSDRDRLSVKARLTVYHHDLSSGGPYPV